MISLFVMVFRPFRPVGLSCLFSTHVCRFRD
uniref:Uncharacterized protein n=1 Tax=Caudovirales sp. ct0jG3 TaxID=2825756 RepID=A0A8S5NS70_9CAUD|nr:MAG TPA: hypothetical protein [Caudovirales sp. ct0jG3]